MAGRTPAPLVALVAVAAAAALAFAGCTSSSGGGAEAGDVPAVVDEAPPRETVAGTIRGTVRSADGPLAGALATLRGRSAVTTNASGAFAFDGVPNGTYELLVELFGYEPVQVPLALQPGETRTLEVTMERLETITERVEKWTYEGFLVCGAGAADASPRCPGAEGAGGPPLDNRVEFNLTVRTPGFESLVVEVVWTSPLPAASGLCFQVEADGEVLSDACGDAGRILWRTDNGDADADVAPESGEPREVLLTFWAAWETAAGQPGASAHAQQSFQAYAHVFYGRAAPTDHSPAAGA